VRTGLWGNMMFPETDKKNNAKRKVSVIRTIARGSDCTLKGNFTTAVDNNNKQDM